MYDSLTGKQFVVANPELQGLGSEEAQKALATVQMEYAQDRKISTYSKGMRQRVKMASALVHEPSVLLLDEPFNGMDPRQRMQLMDLLRRMGAEGRTGPVLLPHPRRGRAAGLAHRGDRGGTARRLRRLPEDPPPDDPTVRTATWSAPATTGRWRPRSSPTRRRRASRST
ncbi:ABC transporter ATP-binding protein OS=Streptomyces microflavus OX=1919 GN=G3I39_32825 PE=4 SV=1 [Streptomyces microflavus]